MFFGLITSAWLDTYNSLRYHLHLHFAFHLQPKETPRQTASDGPRSHKGTQSAIDQAFKENIQQYESEKMAQERNGVFETEWRNRERIIGHGGKKENNCLPCFLAILHLSVRQIIIHRNDSL